MPRPNSVPAVSSARAVAETLIGVAIDLARADEDATGVWADSARRQLADAEQQITRLKADLAKLPTSDWMAAK